MRRRLDRRDVLVVLEKLHLLRGRDVQDMHALAGLARQPDEPLRAAECGNFIAPDRMRARIALDAQVLALVEPVLVLGMERGAPPDHGENVAHALVVLDQERAGGGAHEHLDPGASGQALERGKLAGVLARAADEEGEIAMHAVMRARDLVGQRLRAGGGRTGVGHFEHRGDAAHDRAARAGFEILLVGQAGLAEMHLGVDHARQHMQAPAVDHLTGRSRRQVADRGNAPAGDGEIAHAFAVVVDDGAALEDEVEALGHFQSAALVAGARAPYV